MKASKLPFRRVNSSLLFSALVILASSCSTLFYSPTVAHVPVINEENEFVATGSLGLSPFTTHLNLQAAYGLTDRFALKASYSSVNGDATRVNGVGQQSDVGLGYFINSRNNVVNDFYFDLGMGSLSNYFTGESLQGFFNGYLPYEYIHADFYRQSLQHSFSIKREQFSISFATRLVRVKYYNIDGAMVDDEISIIDSNIYYLRRNSQHFFVEPSLTLRFYVDKIHIQMQMLGSYGYHPRYDLPRDFLNISLGFGVRL